MALTPLFLTGFEHGIPPASVPGVVSTTGSPTIISGAARNGGFGFRSATTTATTASARWAGWSATAKVVVRVAIRLSSLPASGNAAQLLFLATAASAFFTLSIADSGQLTVVWGGGSVVTGPTITTGGWHLVEFQLDASGTTLTADWRVDGAAQTRASVAGTASTITVICLGTENAGTSTSGVTCDYDDLIFGSWTVAGTDWWGDGQCLAQLPGSDGTHNTVADFSPGDAGTAYSGTITTAYTMVDDAPGTGAWTPTRSTTDNLAMRVVNTTAYMEIAPAAATVSGISANAVSALLSYSSSTTAANKAACDVRNSAAAVTALNGTTGGTGAAFNIVANTYVGALVTQPGAGWTATEVNAVRWRFGGCTSSDISPVPTVQGLMLEVDWQSSGPAPIATLTDAFPGTTLNTTRWTALTGTVTVSNGLGLLATTTFSAIASNQPYALSNSSIYWQTTPLPVGAGTYEAAVSLAPTAGGNTNAIEYEIAGNHLAAMWWNSSGVQQGLSTLATPVSPCWLRIREASGTTYFDWSADALSWTNWYSFTTPVSVGSMYVTVLAGRQAADPNATAFFGAFNAAAATPLTPTARTATQATLPVKAAVALSPTARSATLATSVVAPGIPHIAPVAAAAFRVRMAVSTSPPLPIIRLRELPPLRLSVNIVTPDGHDYRWALDDDDSRNVPTSMSFSTTMPGGYEHADLTLVRDPRLDYADLQQMSTITVRGLGGTVAWQGRLETIPSASGQQLSISPGASGWQAALTDNNAARELYVECDLTKWQGPDLNRQIQLTKAIADGGLQIDFDSGSVGPNPYSPGTSDLPAMILSMSGGWLRTHVCEAWYDAQGLPIGLLWFDAQLIGTDRLSTPLTNGALPANATESGGGWTFGGYLCTDDVDSAHDPAVFTGTGPTFTRALTPTAYRPFALLQLAFTGAGGTDTATYQLMFPRLQLFGTQNLPLIASDEDPGIFGVLGSDVLTHAIPKYAPELAITAAGQSTITPSTFVIPELVQLQNGTVADIIKSVTAYEFQDWAVWAGDNDQPTFWWYPRGTMGRKWESRVSPAQLQTAGPQVDRLWNGVIISFNDYAGIQRSVGPPGSGCSLEDVALSDPDPQNPLNTAGPGGTPIRKWAPLSMTSPATPTVARKIGIVFLSEQKLASTAGSAQLTGHVQDDHGILWPVWIPRAGDLIRFVDAAYTGYRRIVSTSYSHDSRVNSITLDTPPDTMQAILSRLQVVLTPITGG